MNKIKIYKILPPKISKMMIKYIIPRIVLSTMGFIPSIITGVVLSSYW